jgi:hypothetical protein
LESVAEFQDPLHILRRGSKTHHVSAARHIRGVTGIDPKFGGSGVNMFGWQRMTQRCNERDTHTFLFDLDEAVRLVDGDRWL